MPRDLDLPPEAVELREDIVALRETLGASRAAALEALGTEATRVERREALEAWRTSTATAETMKEIRELHAELRQITRDLAPAGRRASRPGSPADEVAREEMRALARELAASRRATIDALGADASFAERRAALAQWRETHDDAIAALETRRTQAQRLRGQPAPGGRPRLGNDDPLGAREREFRRDAGILREARENLRARLADADSPAERRAIMREFRERRRAAMSERRGGAQAGNRTGQGDGGKGRPPNERSMRGSDFRSGHRSGCLRPLPASRTRRCGAGDGINGRPPMSLPDIPLGRAFGGLYRWGVVGMLAALGALALLLGLQLRGHLRAQILSRDASLLGAVVELERGDASALEEDALLEGALAASELRDVVGLLATDPAGQPLALIPTSLMLAGLGERDRARAVEEGPFARFHRAFPLALLFDDMLDEEARVPLVEVVVPFAGEEGEVVFFAQFWVDGQVMAREFAVLDRRLLGQGVLAWIAAAAAVSLVFIVALERLRRSARMLDARTLELERMNRELELAARSAAVGSISAHLLHGLKSPLAGLRAYLRAHGDGEALAATGRMQQLVHETLRLLREED
ncbi:MAG: hypothetical protein ACLFR7_06040, partial [Opitutales bacterium]